MFAIWLVARAIPADSSSSHCRRSRSVWSWRLVRSAASNIAPMRAMTMARQTRAAIRMAARRDRLRDVLAGPSVIGHLAEEPRRRVHRRLRLWLAARGLPARRKLSGYEM